LRVRALRVSLEPFRTSTGPRSLPTITREEELEQKLAAAERHLQEAQAVVRSREELLAIVSHDLRNPLGIVLMAATQIEFLVGEDKPGRQIKKATKTIARAVHRMTRLVGDLTDLTKLEAGQSLTIDLATTDVSALVRQAIDLIAPIANARHISVSVDLPAEASAVCDADRVQQILFNLLDNAVKFTRDGGAIVAKAVIDADSIVVSVQDTGTGIAASALARIFEPYWQAEGNTKKLGAGLGLSIAKAVVDAHSGRIWVKTAVGEGSTFHFSLPRAASKREPGGET
jgi:signal transduction histidine kinase